VLKKACRQCLHAYQLVEKSLRQADNDFETFGKVSKSIILMLKDTPDGFLSDFLPFRHHSFPPLL